MVVLSVCTTKEETLSINQRLSKISILTHIQDIGTSVQLLVARGLTKSPFKIFIWLTKDEKKHENIDAVS